MATVKKGRSVAEEKAFDKDTQAMLFEGASLSQLVQLFGQDIRKIKAKLHGLAPVKIRTGHPIYSVKEAARYLVEPIWPIDEYITRMNHADLPMMLRKEYWAGMRSKQIYEMAKGDLWPTDRVIEHLSDILKTISLSLKLSQDVVNRETALTIEQRRIITQLMDRALAEAHNVLEKAMTNRIVEEGVSGGDSTSAEVDAEDDEL
jgi:hypothetical protein